MAIIKRTTSTTLKMENNQLEADYASLLGNYKVVYEDHSNLVTAHNELVTEHNALVTDHDALTQENKALRNTAENLETKLNSSHEDYDKLNRWADDTQRKLANVIATSEEWRKERNVLEAAHDAQAATYASMYDAYRARCAEVLRAEAETRRVEAAQKTAEEGFERQKSALEQAHAAEVRGLREWVWELERQVEQCNYLHKRRMPGAFEEE
ncbi:uncharacterized protein K452DRAFT_313697 [Aplosporella prunicola CBS 121167]|uniref:Uncharacterized protein n=1 Tax=Aplosporella prunicola CBS 121167 TaxID=1176127 RepID=A0A6A6AXX5_9PEZI|nr:uncharacterized protein K452DRAFT_313697 [Aplosporella prunicola CBS 121167]KAF2135814.1 hypothetical protein K452DRAFT_313697 [Aplosporella prunicola CBS 121167]